MNILRASAAAAILALSCVGAAQATPSFATGDSSIFFNNFENLYRPTSSCTVATCLAADAGQPDPAGFQRINPAVANNVAIGDIFVGILNVQNVNSAVSGLDTYNSNAGDRFTGYFAQEIKNITGALATATISLGTASVDPFGILAAGEMYRLYSNVASFSSAGTVAGGVAIATGGTFWASLGLGTEGYQYTRTDLTLPAASSNTESFAGLDFVTLGPGYNAGQLNKLNDFNEDIVGGLIGNPGAQLCSAAEIATVGISCTDIVGTSEIEANNFFNQVNGAGNRVSPWMFASNDPFELNRIPEPGSLALAGLALAGLGLARRRRNAT